jgi:glycerophosphoryl diester phosphodiesterase
MLSHVSFDNWPYLNICAHRGAGKLAPENTLEAFKHGASFGHRMFEFDVKLSADKVSFLLHDDTLDRTTSGQGEAAVFDMNTLELLDAGAPLIRLPRFHNVAHWLLQNSFLANVEIKPSRGREAETGAQIAKECWAIWEKFSRQSTITKPLVPPLLSSFSEVALAAAKEAVPQLPRALLLDSLPSDWLQKCQALEVVALDANYRLLSPEVIEVAKANRLRVVSYTINDRHVLETLFAAGLDCAITDKVDEFRPSAQ